MAVCLYDQQRDMRSLHISGRQMSRLFPAKKRRILPTVACNSNLPVASLSMNGNKEMA